MPRDVLKEIIAKKKERIAQAKLIRSEEELKAKLTTVEPPRDFLGAIKKPRQLNLIAEIKRASPSQGIIRQDFDPVGIARVYEEAGAAAISVLTEEDFFMGHISYLSEVRNAVSLPLLRKDFIIEPYQVYESRYFGADAILLLGSFLTKEALSELIEIAKGLGMACLVEVHTEKELKKILNMGIQLIGINNRDLHTLEVDTRTVEKLFPLIGKERIVVVESGLRNRQDVLFLKILGISAVLIGSIFMESADVRAKVEEIMGW
jgi:indole-3-glycerol phosphate synthase